MASKSQDALLETLAEAMNTLKVRLHEKMDDSAKTHLHRWCSEVSASLQELSRTLDRSESSEQVRSLIMNTKKMIADCAQALMMQLEDPKKIEIVLQSCVEACHAALEIANAFTLETVKNAADEVLDALGVLEGSVGHKGIFLNVKVFGVRLVR